jgi:hypothetical protein
MTKAIGLLAALVLVATACSASSEPEPTAEAGTSTSGLTAIATTTTTKPAPKPTSTSVAVTASTEAPTTTVFTDSSTTTTLDAETNPPNVENWWCATIERATVAGLASEDFARDFDDELRHGYSGAPVETIEEAIAQLGLVQCDPGYAKAVADALVG